MTYIPHPSLELNKHISLSHPSKHLSNILSSEGVIPSAPCTWRKTFPLKNNSWFKNMCPLLWLPSSLPKSPCLPADRRFLPLGELAWGQWRESQLRAAAVSAPLLQTAHVHHVRVDHLVALQHLPRRRHAVPGEIRRSSSQRTAPCARCPPRRQRSARSI